MSTIKNVAIAGATGNLGPAVVNALLDAGYNILILSRRPSGAGTLPNHPNVKLIESAYEADTLVPLFKEEKIDIVISTLTLGPHTEQVQYTLIDAAVEAGVKRFIPSAWGSDTYNPKNAKLPVYGMKVKTADRLAELAKEGKIEYVEVIHGPFYDWCLRAKLFGIDYKEKKVTIYDGGNNKISVTTLDSVGKATAGILQNWDKLASGPVRVHDGVITQNQLLGWIKEEVGADGWKEDAEETAELEKKAYKSLEEGDYSMPVMVTFLLRTIFGEGYGAELKDPQNDVIGLPFSSEEKLKKIAQDVAYQG